MNEGKQFVPVERLREAEARAERAEAALAKIKQNVVVFAAQLQAWGYHDAAKELFTEVLGGNVEAPDYYALKALVDKTEMEREKFALILGHVYLVISRLAADPPDNDTAALIELMTTIEQVVQPAHDAGKDER